MPFYKIDVDEEVYEFLKQNAEPFSDTPNSVLRKLFLGKNGQGPKPQIRTHVSADLPDLPPHIPKALSQILEVIYCVRKLGLSRTAATNLVAQKRNHPPQTIIDKYCRQLGKRAHEVDQMLRPENLGQFQSLLEHRFTKHRDVIKQFFNSLNS